MKVVIVGNGLAGTLAAKTLRELDAEVEIEVYGEEKYAYYPRPNLIEFIAGRLPYERLFAFPETWTDRQRIGLHLGQRIARLRPEELCAESAGGGVVPFDILLLANGARPVVPSFHGAGKKGVFRLRTLDDALGIVDYLGGHRRVSVLGGGLLGLETARALKERGAEVRVVEYFGRLLPRQLDEPGADILKSLLERQGIEVRVGSATEEIIGGDEVRGLKLGPGEEMATDMVVIAAGVRPEVALAAEAGLDVGRGVIVDDRLRTSRTGIFAAGDSVEHRGSTYGIIPAAFDQARTAAYNILGMDKPYAGTTPSATLKVAGLHLTAVGAVNPESDGHEVLTRRVPETGLYKKIVLKEGRLVGAIWMGTKKWAAEITRLVAANKDVARFKEDLLDDEFDFYGM